MKKRNAQYTSGRIERRSLKAIEAGYYIEGLTIAVQEFEEQLKEFILITPQHERLKGQHKNPHEFGHMGGVAKLMLIFGFIDEKIYNTFVELDNARDHYVHKMYNLRKEKYNSNYSKNDLRRLIKRVAIVQITLSKRMQKMLENKSNFYKIGLLSMVLMRKYGGDYVETQYNSKEEISGLSVKRGSKTIKEVPITPNLSIGNKKIKQVRGGNAKKA